MFYSISFFFNWNTGEVFKDFFLIGSGICGLPLTTLNYFISSPYASLAAWCYEHLDIPNYKEKELSANYIHLQF